VTEVAIDIRKPRPTDQGYIASTWVDSMATAKQGPRSDLNRMVDRMLDDQAVRLLIACEPTKTDVILGWLAYTPMPGSRIVHYVYTRDRMRRRGIAAALVRHAFPRDIGKIVHTMRGPDADSLARRYRDTIHLPLTEFLGDQA
jgi:GNAT superfamily N-acetyltransferase